MPKNIVVVGSCMIDFVSYAPRLPKPGETIHGTKFVTTYGGKGANQCVAAAKLGGQTTLVARVGDDVWADKYIENLKNCDVETKYVQKTPNSSSGIAQITVADNGENQIVIVAGANQHLSTDDVEHAKTVIADAAIVVLQLETSVDVALKTLHLCNGISILNGAPGLSKYNLDLLRLPIIFCVNETEAAMFTGMPVNNKEYSLLLRCCTEDAELALQNLISMGCNSAIITLGAQGVLYMKSDGAEIVHVHCPVVQCVDTTGAGDAFIGALAFLLANSPKKSMKKILKHACIIASDSVRRPGTQISFPGREILDQCQ